MSQKTVLVTGATGGIGRPLCQHLAAKGFSLVLVARDIGKLDALANDLSKNYSNQKFKTCSLDFSSLESIKTCFETLKTQHTTLNGLVMMPPQAPPTDQALPTPQTWELLFKESFAYPLEVVRNAIELFPKTGRSKIVIVSGISSAQVLSHYATSNVMRLAWLAEAKTLAFALGSRGVHVNTVSLGGVMTERYKAKIADKAASNNVSFDQQMEQEVGNVPLRKYADPKEVAIVIENLLSEFSDHMTGHNIICDGGFTRAY